MTDFAENLAAERRTAIRLLLRHPLVTAATNPDEFPLIRRHADELARQFSQVLGTGSQSSPASPGCTKPASAARPA